MKKTLLLQSMLLVLTASAALAGGMNINWGTVCYTDAPVSATVFACNTNSTTQNRTITVSFMLDNPMADMVGIEWLITGQSDAPAIPDWWKLGAAPDCRTGKASFSSKNIISESDNCIDWTGGFGFDAPLWDWSTGVVRATMGTAIDASTPFAAAANQEYVSGGVQIQNSKTVGTGACAGCSFGMLFALQNVTAAGLSGRRDDLGSPVPGGNQCLSWNNTTHPCGLPTPARNTTWGQVKSLYR